MIERSPGEIGLEKPPSCYLTVDPRNSIAIRKVLVQDALLLIPRSEWIGTGLDTAGALLPLARCDDASRFVLCSLALVVLPSLPDGRVSRDGVLFALLGCAVGLKETSRASAPARSAVVT